jgi:hypothetical protein
MRITVVLLALLVFAAGLILDTGAVLSLVGGLLWRHAIVAGVMLLVAATAIGWQRLHRRKRGKRGSKSVARRTAGPRQKQAGAGRRRKPAGRSARAR